jgi:hypothetical protein
VDQDERPLNESRGAAAARGLRSATLDGSRLLASAVRFVAAAVVLIVGVGILFALLRATPTNSIVSEIHGWGRWLVGPFSDMFSFHSARVVTAVNWGIAAAVYLFAGALIARLVGRAQHSSTSHKEDS